MRPIVLRFNFFHLAENISTTTPLHVRGEFIVIIIFYLSVTIITANIRYTNNAPTSGALVYFDSCCQWVYAYTNTVVTYYTWNIVIITVVIPTKYTKLHADNTIVILSLYCTGHGDSVCACTCVLCISV